MQVLLRAAFHISRLRSRDATRLGIIIDGDTGLTVDDVTALLSPWRTWLELTDVLITKDTPPSHWFEKARANATGVVSVVSERPSFLESIYDLAAETGLQIARSDYEVESDRDSAFLHEMSHHHFEIGGLNEWDGAPVQYAPFLLQHISAANCVRYFPRYTLDDLRARYLALGRPLEALDVGSGPISRLRWGALAGLMHITGVDPLIDIYDVILAHHGLDRLPAIRVDRAINANAENLNGHVAACSIDFAFCCNALDHVEDPPAVVAQLTRTMRPDALFALEFATREGSRQDWQQLHRFDLFLNADQSEIMCQRHDGRVDPLVPKGTPLGLDRVVSANDDYTIVVLRRWPSGGRGGGGSFLRGPRRAGYEGAC